jgi:hypothetical protein
VSLEGLITARIDLKFMDRARAALANPDLRPAWKELGKPFRADLAEHRKKQEGPDGSWPQLASSTKMRRRSGRRRSRRMLGRLPTAMTLKNERSRMIGRSLVRWSSVHRDGGRAGHGARIPRRDWLWPSQRFLDHASQVIAKGLAYLIEVS